MPVSDSPIHYRRELPAEDIDFEWLHRAVMCYNATWWKGHAPETIRLETLDWRRLGDGYDSDMSRLYTKFMHGTPYAFVEDKRTGEVLKFTMYSLVDFNEFDFGALCLPEHGRN